MGYVCPACGHSLADELRTFEHRRKIALHRQEHARLERRRAAYRESKRRARALALHPDVVGWLHSVGCDGQHRRGTSKCVPLPCYSRPVVA